MKKIVKGEEITGYFEIKFENKRYKFDNANKKSFLPFLYKVLASKVCDLISGPFQIVPIPNKSALSSNNKPYQTLLHAQEIAKLTQQRATVVDSLRWQNQLPQSHKVGGFRDPQVHYENLVVVRKPTTQYILFDDLITSGSQMIASARKLAESGRTPNLGLTIGRAVKDQRKKMVEWSSQEVETEDSPLIWSLD